MTAPQFDPDDSNHAGKPYCLMVADSISPEGVRLTTQEVRIHRFVLAEFNTHRVFSRNSASSRAIPVHKQIERIRRGIAYPVSWPAEKKGMQGGEELDPATIELARKVWRDAADKSIDVAMALTAAGLHKSVVNRLLEPFMWHTVVVTSTAFGNWDSLRLDSDAQPEIRRAAILMRANRDDHEPKVLQSGEWHLPYVSEEECSAGQVEGITGIPTEELDWAAGGGPSLNLVQLCRISAARCARVSYLTQDGKRDIQEDLRLYDQLVTNRVDTGKGVHWSPLEHVATPWAENRQEGCIHFGQDPDADHDTFTCIPLDHLPRTGNLLGWRSLRTEVEAANNARTFS